MFPPCRLHGMLCVPSTQTAFYLTLTTRTKLVHLTALPLRHHGHQIACDPLGPRVKKYSLVWRWEVERIFGENN